MSNKLLKTVAIVLGLALLISAGAKILTPSGEKRDLNNASKQSALPQSIQGINLSQEVSGEQAMQMVNRLHGGEIAVKQAYIGVYDGAQGQITLWVSESGSEREAKDVFDLMDRKIIEAGQKANAPFTGRRSLERKGINVISVKGMGMENYYWQKGNRVYWIAAKGADHRKALDEVL